jgi:hypothetical protein
LTTELEIITSGQQQAITNIGATFKIIASQQKALARPKANRLFGVVKFGDKGRWDRETLLRLVHLRFKLFFAFFKISGFVPTFYKLLLTRFALSLIFVIRAWRKA